MKLDDAKEEVDIPKTGAQWNDHWVIQLITVRGEMHSTFSASPKQGTRPNSVFLFFIFHFSLAIMGEDG